MSAVTIAAQITGTADVEDRQAMVFAIDTENAFRVSRGESELPKATAAERRTSMESILTALIVREFSIYSQNAADKANQDSSFRAVKTKWNELSPAQRTAWLNFNP